MCTDLQRRQLLTATAAAAVALPGLGFGAGDDIVVGQIGPFTGTPVPGAPEINLGLKAAFAVLNAAGGINGRKLSLFELDDGFKEDGFVRQFAEAMKRRPVALLSPVGTGSVQRMLDEKLLDTADVVVLNAVPGAESLRSPGHAKLFHIRAGDRQQVERIVRHAVTLGITHMAVLCQDLSIGTSGLAAAEKVAAGLDMKLSTFMAPAEAGRVAEAAHRAAASQAQSALVLGSPRFAAEGIVALRQAGLAKSIYALSYVSPALIRQLAGGASRGAALAQVYPNPNGSTMVLQHDFQAAMKRAGTNGPYSAFHLEGYVTARVLAEGLKRAREPSPSGLARALRAMGPVNLGGFHVNFSKENVGSSFVDIAVINGEGRLMY
jgi:branched-chain amino acid transport system substrate-binding protein